MKIFLPENLLYENKITQNNLWDVVLFSPYASGASIQRPRHQLTVYTYVVSRLTIVSSEAKKKQAVRDKPVSYLHVRSSAVKFVDALNKPPLKLSLSYLGLSTF